MNKFFAAIFFFLLPFLSLHAGSILGTYSVSGVNTDNSTYTGTLIIEKDNQVLTAAWTFDDGSQEKGTGFLKDNILSFVFQDINDCSHTGIQIYEVISCGHLKGPWAFIDSNIRGCETIKKISDHHCCQ